MAEPMETSESDVSSDEEHDDDQFSDGIHYKNVCDAIHQYFMDGRHCDVTLAAGLDEKRIPAHRVILFANSRYFEALINEDMKEVAIQEVNGDMLEALISFCFTGKMSINKQNVGDIFAAASFMKMDQIKKLCEEFNMREESESGQSEMYVAVLAEMEQQRKVCNAIYKYFKEDKHCDVILEAGTGIDKQRIPAHRVILFANTPYFESMLNEDMKEVTIQEVSGDVLQALVNFCYTGEILLNKENLGEYRAAASSLKLVRIEKLCEEFYLRWLSFKNCLRLRAFADQNNLKKVKVEAETILMNKFQLVIQEKEFQDLQIDTLKWLLENDEIYVYSEEEVFNAIIRWIEFDEEQRKCNFGALVSLVRIQQIKQTFLVSTVRGYCQKWNQSDLFFHLMDIHDNKVAGLQPRLCFSQQPLLFADNELLDPVKNAWRSFHREKCFCDSTEFVVQVDNCLYLIGDSEYEAYEQNVQINLRTSQSKRIASRNWILPIMAATSFQNVIYCIGHADHRFSVDKYEIANDKWVEDSLGSQVFENGFFGTDGLRMSWSCGLLLVIGNNTYQKMLTYCHNPTTGKWHSKARLPISHALSRSLNLQLYVQNDMFTVVHMTAATGNIYVYDMAADKWNRTAKFGFDRPIELEDVMFYKDILYIYAEEKTKDDQTIRSIYSLSDANGSLQRVTDVPSCYTKPFFIKPYDPSQ